MMGKPQYKSQAHVIAHYQSEVMDVIQTHTEGIVSEVWADIKGDVMYLLTEMVKDSERIKQKEQED